MAETRFPTLNILDAIYVSFRPGNGPDVQYSGTSYAGIVAASTDLVALDFWAAKHILMPQAAEEGYPTNMFNPDVALAPLPFAKYLDKSMVILQESGFSVTTDRGCYECVC